MQRPSYRRREFFIGTSRVLVAGATREIPILRPALSLSLVYFHGRSIPSLPLARTCRQTDVTSIARKKFRSDRRRSR